jgi:hypothetical protein
MTNPIRPAVEVFVEELAKALCAASSQQWRTNDGLSAWAITNVNPDALNNHWRYKARALLPIIEADRAAIRAITTEGADK